MENINHFLFLLDSLVFEINFETFDELPAMDISRFYPTLQLLLNRYKTKDLSNPDDWLDKYEELKFYEFFRMRKVTFEVLLHSIIKNDEHKLICKKYRGGNYPVDPDKALLVFLYFVSHNDTLGIIGDRFNVSKSCVMHIVNAILFIMVNKLKNKFIFWPITQEEVEHVVNGFKKYPGKI